MKILVLFLMVSCVMESKFQGSVISDDSGTSATARDIGSTPIDSEEDHPNIDYGDTQTLEITVLSDEYTPSMLLGDKRSISLTIKAKPEYTGGTIQVDIDKTDIGSKYVIVKSSDASFDIQAGQEKRISLDLEVLTMAPSFTSKDIKVSFSDTNSTKQPVEMILKLEVKSEVEFKILSAGKPHVYSHTQTNICFGSKHKDGVQVTFVNMSNDFGDDRDYCLHITGRGLQHCDTSNGKINNMGDKYVPGTVKVTSGQIMGTFYNHFGSSDDNINRRLYFNLNEGDENGKCDQ